MKSSQKTSKILFILMIFLSFILSNCSTRKLPNTQVSTGQNTNDTPISSFAKVPEIPEEDIEEWNRIMDDIVRNYPLTNTRKSGITRAANPTKDQIIAAMKVASTKYNVPYEILYGIGYEESNLKQFKSDGQPLISGDGGIGITQVTPWAVSERFDEYSLKWDYQYNIEAGAQVILGKWKYASNRNPIGDNNPLVLENWYITIWAYNGYSNVNNPNQYVNGPHEWCNSQICWTRVKAYQDEVLDTIYSLLGTKITPIPLSQLPASGIPASGKSFNTPAPIHYTSGESFDPTTALGSHSNPFTVNSFPYTNSGTTVAREKKFNTYSCSASSEAGPEQVYKVTVSSAGKLKVSVTDGTGVDIDVHLLSSLNNNNCLTRHDASFEYEINAGTYYVIADTYGSDSNAGGYIINIDFEPAAVPGSHSIPYTVNSFPFTKSSSTVAKEKKFNSYNCSTASEAGPEEVYKVTIAEKGKLTVSLTDGAGVDIDIHLLSALNNNACITRHDSSFTYELNPGTYYLIADTYSSDSNAGNYTISMTFAKTQIPGSNQNPYLINSFSYTKSSTTTGKQKVFNSYNCSTASEAGPEEVYKLIINEPGQLTATVTDGAGVDVDIHLLSSLSSNSCLTRGDTSITYNVNPGTYYIVADTYSSDSNAGSYQLTLKFTKTLFKEIFDNNTSLSGWSRSNTSYVTYYTGTTKIGTAALRLKYASNAVKTFSTIGYDNIRLKFKMAAYSLEAGEKLIAEYNYGTGWIAAATLVDGQDNSTYRSYNITLAAGAAHISNLQIRFRISSNSTADYGYVDEIYLEGTSR